MSLGQKSTWGQAMWLSACIEAPGTENQPKWQLGSLGTLFVQQKERAGGPPGVPSIRKQRVSSPTPVPPCFIDAISPHLWVSPVLCSPRTRSRPEGSCSLCFHGLIRHFGKTEGDGKSSNRDLNSELAVSPPPQQSSFKPKKTI